MGKVKVLKLFFLGFIFGFFSPVPGVSAGSMAVFLNVYDSFFNSVSVAYIKKNLLLTISFLGGWVLGLFGVSNIILYLLDNFGEIVAFCFIGLVLGCVPVIYKKAAPGKIKVKYLIICLAAFALMLFLAFYGSDLNSNNHLEQLGGATPAILAWLFAMCFISSMAMLIPGVGGSLMMLVLGIYTIYIEAIAHLDVLVLAVLFASMVFGVIAGIFLTKKMLNYFPQVLYSIILGLILGSSFAIYSGFTPGMEGFLSIALAIIFAVFSYWLATKDKEHG